MRFFVSSWGVPLLRRKLFLRGEMDFLWPFLGIWWRGLKGEIFTLIFLGREGTFEGGWGILHCFPEGFDSSGGSLIGGQLFFSRGVMGILALFSFWGGYFFVVIYII